MKPASFVLYCFLIIGFAGTALYADEGSIWTLYPRDLAVGQVGLFSVQGIPGTEVAGTFLNREIYFHRSGERLFALLPVDLRLSPGTYPLNIEYQDITARTKKNLTVYVEVHPFEFCTEELTLPEKMVTFPEEILKRILDEQRTIHAVLEKQSQAPLWNGAFIRPVGGDVVGSFGSRRILNGKERSPHLGADIRAKEGTPVLCVNTGRVALVGDFYLMGNTVVIDHGQGVFTLYCHLSRAGVKEGELVPKGKVLGEVGATGRATGPHLHWGTCISGARVDPTSLVEATTAVPGTGN